MKYPGKLIAHGAKGKEVEEVQKLLNGFAVTLPKLEVDGIFGSDTDAAVRAFQMHTNLEDDGIVGPLTWAALVRAPFRLGTPTASKLGAEIVKIARTQLHVRETPGQNNRGPEVDEYIRRIGLNPEDDITDPWCVAYAYWCVDEAAIALGVENQMPKIAGVIRCWNAIPASMKITADQVRANPALLKPGAIFFVDHSRYIDTPKGKRKIWRGHAGIVAEPHPSFLKFTSIEGNTNVAGSREGQGVYQRMKYLRQVNLGFLQLP